MRTIQAPTVQLNGTSQSQLMNDYDEAGTALQEALRLLSRTAPHGRDYLQVKGSQERFTLAQQEHQHRMDRLHEVYDELCALYNAVDERQDTVVVERRCL
jgi:hypothetical protein